MSIKDVTLDPEIADLVSAAFDRSWQFVKADPELAHVDVNEKRAQLSRCIAHLVQSGERDLWRLANRAIGDLRRQLCPDQRLPTHACGNTEPRDDRWE
jgi:hypothetical protein